MLAAASDNVDQALSANSWPAVVALAIVLLGVPFVTAYVQKINRSLNDLKENTKTNRDSGGSMAVSMDQLHDKQDRTDSKMDRIQEQLDGLCALPSQVRKVQVTQKEEHGALSSLVEKVEANTQETRALAVRVTALELHSADRVVVDALSFAELANQIQRIGEDPAPSPE